MLYYIMFLHLIKMTQDIFDKHIHKFICLILIQYCTTDYQFQCKENRKDIQIDFKTCENFIIIVLPRIIK